MRWTRWWPVRVSAGTVVPFARAVTPRRDSARGARVCPCARRTNETRNRGAPPRDFPGLGQRADVMAKQTQSLATTAKQLASLLTTTAAPHAVKRAYRVRVLRSR